MRDDVGRASGRSGSLLRQAYLLTGDAKHAERLADRALAASTLHTRRAGPEGADEHARAELIRLFVAEAPPGRHAHGPAPVSGGQVPVWEALGGLPARRRAVLVLRYDEGLSEDEIAARMDSTPRSVLADTEAALLTLRTALRGESDPGRVMSDVLTLAGSRWGAWSDGDGVPAVRPAPSGAAAPGGGRGSDRGPWGDGGPWGDVAAWRATAPAGAASGGSQGGGYDGPPAAPPRRGPVPPYSAGTTPSGLPRRGAPAPQDAAGPPAPTGAAGSAGTVPRRGETPSTGDTPPPGARPYGGTPQPAGGPASGHGDRDSDPYGDAARRAGASRHRTAVMGSAGALNGGAPNGSTERGGTGSRGTDVPFGIAAFPLEASQPHRRFRTPTVIAAAALTTLVLGTVAVAVPALLNDDDSAPGAPTATEVAGEATVANQIPSRSVPKGLLDWPARGPKAGDEQVLAAASAAWKATAKAGEAPAKDVSMLYAGSLDGRQVAILQGLDGAGRPRLAQLAGSDTDTLALVHSEPLMMPRAAVLSILPASGPAGAIRVLVSPEGQAANGLLSSDPMSGEELKKIPLDRDGISEVLPSPPGVPTCSRVVVMGLPGPLGRSGPRVLESGIVAANMLESMPMEVEVGSSTLAAADDATPRTLWFADGAQLLKKLGGKKKGAVVIAALGPRVAAQPVSGTSQRINSRAYEVRRGKERYLGSVVSFGARTICTTVTPVRNAGVQPPLSAFVLRCPGPAGTAGMLHVVGGADVQSVQVSLAPTPQPAGQQPYGNSVDRPAGSSGTSSFAVLDIVPAGFPCGGGTVQATGGASAAPPIDLPVFTP